jgi:hypothetical protein
MIASGFVHRKVKGLVGIIAALAVFGSVVSPAFAPPPKDTLRYQFSPTTDLSNIKDSSGNGNNGFEVSGDPAQAFLVPGHKGSPKTAVFLSGVDTLIDTQIDTGSIGIDNNAFTAMAFINRATVKGDNFVFGTDANAAPDLHLGFREKVTYVGFWGNDSAGAIIGTFKWHHWAVRFDPTIQGGSQDVFIDGVMVAHDAPHNAYVGNGSTTLKIGQGGGGGGRFSGAIEDARLFTGVALRDDQISAAANDLPIPP